MKFFKSLIEEKKKFKDFYDDRERDNVSMASLIFTLIIGVLASLISVQVFLVLVHRPYLAYTLCGIALLWLITLFFIFQISNFKKLRQPEDFSLLKAFLLDYLITVIVVIVIVVLLEVITVPLFFL
ncbi:MAG: hypothetical protein K6F59_04035 [Gammaproteobacteria bacterium]|nr:hypothetical protein [Gammaproteobacteria bacterium]